MTKDPDYIKEQLQLKPHPEGGFYRETYRDEQTINIGNKVRNTSTAIYYFLENDDKSHFHRVGSDECWFFHQGETIEIFILGEDGNISIKALGNKLEAGEEPQVIIPANTWFAAELKNKKGYTLVSCTVAPEFEFADFELGNKNDLLTQFPEHNHIIERLAM